MKRCLKLLAMTILIAATLLPAVSQAYSFYLLPESDSRLLTKEEIAQWKREDMAYLFNEIFARHGFSFREGGRYDNFFSGQDWYYEDDTSDHKRCYGRMSRIEWQNEHLIKVVMDEIDRHERADSGHKRVSDFSFMMTGLSGFVEANPRKGFKNLPVYSAPTEAAWRGARGKASLDVSWPFMAAGWDNGWLLVYYETNKKSIRVGYCQPGWDTGIDRQLSFSYSSTTITRSCVLTDDPARTNVEMRRLNEGTQVTYLTSYYGYGKQQTWAYIETTVDGLPARGFVPQDCVAMGAVNEDGAEDVGAEWGLGDG